jgi:hypothetical protein
LRDIDGLRARRSRSADLKGKPGPAPGLFTRKPPCVILK